MTITQQQPTIMLEGPAGHLETLVVRPAITLHNSVPIVAVIGHPHPLHGGTMNNKVVTTLARTLLELGIIAIRFNFRGVGASEGQYDEGMGETEDMLAVCRWAHQQFPQHRLWLAGFSFGSFVAYRTAHIIPTEQLISIAPPVYRFPFENSMLPACQWLVVQGEQDEIVDPQAVFNWLAKLPVSPVVLRFTEAGHFFHGKLVLLRQQLQRELKQLWPELHDVTA
ncbi:MAG: Dot/Icm type IV secretion system effector CoxH3 [Gammaproteobacteria bacterium]